MTYKCIYCDTPDTDAGTCWECSIRIRSIKRNPKAFFNILSVLADEKGFELNLYIDDITYDEWVC